MAKITIQDASIQCCGKKYSVEYDCNKNDGKYEIKCDVCQKRLVTIK